MMRTGFTGTASGTDDPRLVAALEECLAGLDQGLAPDRAALQARYPDLAGDLFACLDGLEFVHRASPGPLPRSGALAIPDVPGRIGDYRLIREVGRGGMGIVYEAEQVSLNRRVALKVLPFASALDSGQLQRFQNEARVGAVLQHPHIVPVYATGCERGVHYYAMQFIDGPSLADLIAARRAVQSANRANAGAAVTPGNHALPTVRSSARVSGSAVQAYRDAARLGAEAARALEAAHQAGVIHRDIKPSNLLLDDAGVLRVADFGLARINSDPGQTRTGNLLGTLRYMSPEQALGLPGLVDHRTDLYALGATLYELLTLRPAFTAGNREELLRQIDREEPPSPCALDPGIPSPLEAIVLKAMAKHPADRYASAAEFAADLDRFLAGQRVSARRPSLVSRCRRWAARHNTAVLTTAIVASLLLAMVSIASWAVSRERDAAESRKVQARRAVDEMYTEVAERWLKHEPHLELVQRDFLEKARRFYDEFASDVPNDPLARFEAARAARRLGDIDCRLGQFANATSEYSRAGALLTGLEADRPGSSDLCEESALLQTGRGTLALANNHISEAEEEFRSALTCYEQLASRSALRRYALGRAGCQVNLGVLFAATGRLPEAEKAYGSALEMLEAQTNADTSDAEGQFDLAGVLTDLGNLLGAARFAEAEAHYRRSLAIEDRLLASAPARPAYRHARASTSLAVAMLLLATDRYAEARSFALQALDLRVRLARDFPNTPRYQEEAAAARITLGDVFAAAGRPGQARSWYESATVNYQRLAQSPARDSVDQRGAAEAQSRQGDLLLAAGQADDARDHYRAALSQLSHIPGASRLKRQDRARAWSGLGAALAAGGHSADGKAASATAVAEWGGLVAESLADDTDRWGLAVAVHQHATLQDADADTAADSSYQRAISICERLSAEHPRLSGYRLVLAAALAGQGDRLVSRGCVDKAESQSRRALAIARELVAEHPEIPEYRRLLAACLIAKGRVPDRSENAEEYFRRGAAISRALAASPARTLADERNIAVALERLAEYRERAGQPDAAADDWRERLRQQDRLAQDYPQIPAHRGELGWLLANCPAERLRDPHRARAEAQFAVALAPQNADGWLARGASAYRCGDWSEARTALERAARRPGGDASPAGYFLAMACWQQGDYASAVSEFDRAEATHARNRTGDYQVDRLRQEAAALIDKTMHR